MEVKEDGGIEGPVLGKSALQYLREAHALFRSRMDDKRFHSECYPRLNLDRA
jgi:hypothetical protein